MRLDLAKFSSDPESRFTTSICSIVLTVTWLFDQSQQILKWNKPIILQSKNISPECQQREIIHPMPTMQMHVSQAQENLQLVPRQYKKMCNRCQAWEFGTLSCYSPLPHPLFFCNLFASVVVVFVVFSVYFVRFCHHSIKKIVFGCLLGQST